MNNMNELKARLSQAGIPLNEPTSSAQLQTPWFVRALQAFSGWLAALFLLGFIAMGVVFMVESPAASLGLGLAMIGAACALLRSARSDVLEHLALAVSLAGQLLVAWAAIEFWSESAYSLWSLLGWSLFGLQAVLALVIPSLVHRTFSAFAASLALYMALAVSDLELVANGLVLLALTLLWLNEFRWPQRIRSVQAWGYGLLMGLLVIQGLAHSGQPFWLGVEGQQIGDGAWMALGIDLEDIDPWLSAVLLALTLVLLLYSIFHTLRSPMLYWHAAIGVAVMLLISLYLPAVVQGVVVLLLGFAIGHRLLVGLGMFSLLLAMGSYYYWLDTTLLIKALTLIVIGVMLLSLRWLLRWLSPLDDKRELKP
ncbi:MULTISPECIES: DUF4401 domain-containing protein [unclassified Halomonas]|uniref:DUF4401 domain-containing protein n=1 Tax=unclassified Halomonas TaxID=2609666 RepID=UPI0007D96D4C|nr:MULTISPECIES: DUF4401 domain-containing protein [unclassified Halomonas]MBT2787052.1 DUF4401 domain-containing protein [Halomonas sp. ISL-106]MBT2795394.1 DUF4401 domain-containing protein [Halomonas sp. ISL-104]OAL57906.1 hypothetical protein A6R74_10900 [Halomonas sp. ALS9]